jgi:hypothetical protein
MSALLLVALLAIQPAPADESRRLADSLLAHGYYEPAATEYERALFLAGDRPELRDSLNLCRGLALGAIGRPAAAARALHSVSGVEPGGRATAGLALAGIYHADGDDESARLEITGLLLTRTDSIEYRRLGYAAGWLDLRLLRLNSSAAAFERAGRTELAGRVRAAYARPGRRNPTAALLMSALLPGSGEVYAGNPGRGLISFLTVGASAAGVYWAARSDDWVSAAAVFSVLFVRFYDGAIRNAARRTDDFNRELMRRRREQLMLEAATEPDWFSGGCPETPRRLSGD